MIENSRRRIDDLQRRVDEGVKESVSRLRSVPGFGVELERLETGMRDIEARLRSLLAKADEQEHGGESAAQASQIDESASDPLVDLAPSTPSPATPPSRNVPEI